MTGSMTTPQAAPANDRDCKCQQDARGQAEVAAAPAERVDGM